MSLLFAIRKKAMVLGMQTSRHGLRAATLHNSKGIIPIMHLAGRLNSYDSVFETYVVYAPSSCNDLKFPNMSYRLQPHVLYTGTCLHLECPHTRPLWKPSLLRPHHLPHFAIPPLSSSGTRHDHSVPKEVCSVSVTEPPT